MIMKLDLFYVRNHLPVAEVDIKEYELEVSGLGIKVINLYQYLKYRISQ